MGEGTPLESLQRWMQNALIFPSRTDGEETGRVVKPSPRLSAPEQLAIYQRSYYLRLLRCMEEQFPALRHALGEGLFCDFAREYLAQLPSASYTLYELGGRFPGYLESARPDRDKPEGERERWIDFMVDLAQCERDLFVMFDAPGHEGRPFADAGVPDDRLRLQPCLRLHEYRFPVSRYYHQVREEKHPALPPAGRTWVVLVRKDYVTRTFPLPEPHYRLLGKLAAGMGVAQALGSVAGESGRSFAEIDRVWSGEDGLRRHWIEAGFFIEG